MAQPDDMFDDEDYPAYTMGRAAEITGATAGLPAPPRRGETDHPVPVGRRSPPLLPLPVAPCRAGPGDGRPGHRPGSRLSDHHSRRPARRSPPAQPAGPTAELIAEPAAPGRGRRASGPGRRSVWSLRGGPAAAAGMVVATSGVPRSIALGASCVSGDLHRWGQLSGKLRLARPIVSRRSVGPGCRRVLAGRRRTPLVAGVADASPGDAGASPDPWKSRLSRGNGVAARAEAGLPPRAGARACRVGPPPGVGPATVRQWGRSGRS